MQNALLFRCMFSSYQVTAMVTCAEKANQNSLRIGALNHLEHLKANDYL